MANMDLINAEAIVKNYNESRGFGLDGFDEATENGPTTSYYIISASGSKKAYYTLYFFSLPVWKMNNSRTASEMEFRQHWGMSIPSPYQYRKNLSIDVKEAIQKVIDYNSKLPILLLEEEQLNKIIKVYGDQFMTFGKYRGMRLDKMFAKDQKYSEWVVKSLEDKYPRTAKEENILNILKSLLESYKEELFNQITEQNKENIVSEWIETSKIENVELEVIKVKKYSDDFGTTTKIFATDNANHFFTFYGKENAEAPQKGMTIKIKRARVNKNFEILGVKYSYLNYIKF